MSTSSSPADPDSADPVIVVLTADTATLAESRERALAERAAKRHAISSKKRAQSKDRQAFGVTLMKIKNYEGAAVCFADACNLWRSNPVCHCDLATAYLHLGRFEDAEGAASAALALDPRLVEARYTRAMARKGRGLVRGAIVDLETVLELSADNEAAQTALHELRAGVPDTETAAETDTEDATAEWALPAIDAEKLEVDSGSDTSDANHTGNAVPCLFYNHQGCARGNDCKFSHAPDEKSVRDDLGKNVCLYFLLGQCKFDTKCIYAHSRAYLPARGWWNDEKKIEEMKERIEEVRERAREVRARKDAQRTKKGDGNKEDGRDGGEAGGSGSKGGGGRGKGKGKGRGRGRGKQQGRREVQMPMGDGMGGLSSLMGGMNMSGMDMNALSGMGLGGMSGMAHATTMHGLAQAQAELEQRMANFGFTDYDLNELMSQGVKPWDEDAGAVLAALSY
ncbi:hypothetical protein C8R44DRAFT_858094 [Mycena epipterygia]|nr:hypothetical protein C8R44DRAFT_858094 [Mycena epipterygia]